jgi:hypothetical protein
MESDITPLLSFVAAFAAVLVALLSGYWIQGWVKDLRNRKGRAVAWQYHDDPGTVIKEREEANHPAVSKLKRTSTRLR